MSRTFYGVLGVGPDADDEAIRAAYRERVKEHHPDVSADPDAAERFKRLTAAKETLLDAAERARYDRLGHRAYVSSHGDSTLWATEPSPEPSTSSTRESTTEASDSDDGVSSSDDVASGSGDAAADRSRNRDGTTGSSRSGSTGTWAGRAEANRRSATRGGGRRAGRRTRTDGARRSGSSQSRNATASSTDDGGDGTTGETASDRSTDSGVGPGSSDSTGPDDSEASSSGEGTTNRETPGGTDTGATGSGAAAGKATDGTRRRRRSSTGSYATTSFWEVTDDRPSAGRSPDPVTRRALAALRRLGPWLLVHVIFLSLAVGTGWYVYAVVLPPAERSVALLFVLIGEVGVAVVLSSLHILSRLYR